MKTLCFIGDSIRAGYDKAAKKTLEGKANVVLIEDCGRFASYLLRNIGEYLEFDKGTKFDVIHWNAGLWDCLRLYGEEPHTPIDIYEYYIDRICARLKRFLPDATIIFATSTSVVAEELDGDFRRTNEDIELYNEAAIKIVKKYGFEINDLYTLSKSLPKEAHSDPVHYYTPIGTEAFTNRVLRAVAPHLGLDEIPEYREELYTDSPVGM